jgi:[ribosomal protein S5]-alanine N-acetyltransferase
MELVPIKASIAENSEFINNPLCQETLPFSVDYYKVVGFSPPWICYYARQDGELVGSAAFKGRPVNGVVEIAYSTFDNFRKQGFGATICQKLVELSLKTDSSVRITARTLPETNYSTRILEKNNFKCLGVVEDSDDGLVWEWEYRGKK